MIYLSAYTIWYVSWTYLFRWIKLNKIEQLKKFAVLQVTISLLFMIVTEFFNLSPSYSRIPFILFICSIFMYSQIKSDLRTGDICLILLKQSVWKRASISILSKTISSDELECIRDRVLFIIQVLEKEELAQKIDFLHITVEKDSGEVEIQFHNSLKRNSFEVVEKVKILYQELSLQMNGKLIIYGKKQNRLKLILEDITNSNCYGEFENAMHD